MTGWDGLVTAALLGTQRRGPDVAGWPAGLGEAAGRLQGDPAAVLLSAAALGVVARRAGSAPLEAAAPGPPAGPEDRRPLPPAAAARLTGFAEGIDRDLFAEWLAAAAEAGFLAPPHLLPPLLDLATRSTAVRPAVTALAGRRGAWLAAQRPEWGRILAPAPAEDLQDDTWLLGSATSRAAWLAGERGRDPDAARAALEATWTQETAADRAGFLALLRTGLSSADEDFLTGALHDRARDVRTTAADLLLVVRPRSDYAEEAARQAAETVSGRRRDGRTSLVVHLWVGLAEGRRAAALQEVVAGAPLAGWAELGTPAELLTMPVEDGWAPVLRAGWRVAAVRERHPVWAAALIPFEATAGRKAELLAVLPPVTRVRVLVAVVRETARGEGRAELGRIRDVATLLPEVPGPWPPELGTELLRWVAATAPASAPQPFAWLWPLLRLRLPPEAEGAVRALAGGLPPDSLWRPHVAAVARTLTTRAQMLQELQ